MFIIVVLFLFNFLKILFFVWVIFSKLLKFLRWDVVVFIMVVMLGLISCVVYVILLRRFVFSFIIVYLWLFFRCKSVSGILILLLKLFWVVSILLWWERIVVYIFFIVVFLLLLVMVIVLGVICCLIVVFNWFNVSFVFFI